ncbi:MAG: hypothetical protein ACJ76G_07055, partial [Solirubrobacterales bacterium]
MEIVIAAAVLAVGLVIAAALLVKRAPGLAAAGPARSATSRAARTAKLTENKETNDAYARRQEIGRLEERLTSREEALAARSAELDAREEELRRSHEEAI